MSLELIFSESEENGHLVTRQIKMEVDSSEMEKSDIDADIEVSWKIIYIYVSICTKCY